MTGIGHAGLEERQLAVELHAFLLQGMFRNGQLGAAGAADHTLVGQVVNGEQGRGLHPAPVHVCRRQARGPVMGMDQVGLPVDHANAFGDVGRRQAQAGKADMVVRPVAAIVGTIGRAFALVEFGADQDIDYQAIGHVHTADLAGRQGSMAAQFADDVDGVVTGQHLRVTGYQYPYIMQVPHGPGQGGRNVAEATGLDQVGDLGCDEQYFLLVGIFPLLPLQCLACRSEIGHSRLATLFVEMLSVSLDNGTDH
ncbi:hypothetical protein D3C80_1123400 [compost metagenome]